MDIPGHQHMNIRTSTRGKRPLRNLTPSDKVRIIQRIRNGETKASVSRDIGVPESTLRGWCKNEQKLRFMCHHLDAADEINAMQSIENPPEKRSRFDNHIQTQKHSASTRFDQLGMNRMPLNGLSFPTNATNAILEQTTFNETFKNHTIPVESYTEAPGENISAQSSGMIEGSYPASGDFSSQLLMMHNFLLSLFSPTLSAILNPNAKATFDEVKKETAFQIIDEAEDNTNTNGNTCSNIICNKSFNNNQASTSSLSVKNWCKDPAEQSLPSFTTQNRINDASAVTTTKDNPTTVNNDSDNKLDDQTSYLPSEDSPNALNFPPPLLLGPLQINNLSDACDSESGSNTALLEWYKIFTASLNLLALAAAAASLQPNVNFSFDNAVQEGENSLYKELLKTINLFDPENNPTPLLSTELSTDCYSESEPEDLSVRSTATTELRSPSKNPLESRVERNGSCSPLHSDG